MYLHTFIYLTNGNFHLAPPCSRKALHESIWPCKFLSYCTHLHLILDSNAASVFIPAAKERPSLTKTQHGFSRNTSSYQNGLILPTNAFYLSKHALSCHCGWVSELNDSAMSMMMTVSGSLLEVLQYRVRPVSRRETINSQVHWLNLQKEIFVIVYIDFHMAFDSVSTLKFYTHWVRVK